MCVYDSGSHSFTEVVPVSRSATGSALSFKVVH